MYRINELLKADRKIFHSGDLAVLWGITNKNTLYTTIKRYVDGGLLIPIYKGLYSTWEISKLNPIQLGASIIHRYCYLTTETVLSQAGVINRPIYLYTFASDISKKITIQNYTYLFRKMKDKYLYNLSGVTNRDGVNVAKAERAVADMLYYNPNFHFDAPDIVDWKMVRKIQREVKYI